MIGEIFDKAVSVFNPSIAAKRAHARNVFKKITERGYDAAKRDRTNSRWATANQSADLEMFAQADFVRGRARDLVRNNAYAKGILRAIVRNVVGRGIMPQAQIEGREELNEKLESLWAKWSDVADVTGRLSFPEIQRLALWEVHEAGECLIHFVKSDDRGRPLPLAIELIEADRLAGDETSIRLARRTTENEIRRGVELDDAGRPIAYWLYPSNPNDVNTRFHRPERHPAENFIHLYKQDRIGQTRGMSSFAPIVLWLKNLHFYTENELQASAVASCFTVAIKTMGGPVDAPLDDTIDLSSSDADGNAFEYLQPGLVTRLFPGEELEMVNPSRPNAQADAWINLMLRSMAVGMGLSYERLTRDYSSTNFSSNRASDLEDRREFRPEQDWLIRALCVPTWHRFLEQVVIEEVDAELLSAIELLTDFDGLTAHRWQPPGWEWVDPKNQATANHQGLEDNTTTLAEILGERGIDWRETLQQKAKEKELIEELGLEPDEEEQSLENEPETATA